MNPDALVGAAEPTVKRLEIEGARIYTEVRGSGDPVLLIGQPTRTPRCIGESQNDSLCSIPSLPTTGEALDEAIVPMALRSARHADDAAVLSRVSI